MSRPAAPPGSPGRLGALSTAQLRALLQDEPRLQRAARLSRKGSGGAAESTGGAGEPPLGRPDRGCAGLSVLEPRATKPVATKARPLPPHPRDPFQSLQLERETCLASNCTQARVNLSLRPRLEDGKASLAIKYQELQEIREACWDKQQRLEAYLEKWSPQSALGQLQAKLDDSEAESEAQIKQFLAQDLPLESFLESFCQSRTRSHVCRTQLEKLQELLQKDRLQKDQSGVTPKAFDLSYGFVPAVLIPSEAVVPFPVPTAPPKHHLPALGQQPASPCSEIPSLGSPVRLVGHIPLLSPQPGRGQQQPQHQKQEPPHR